MVIAVIARYRAMPGRADEVADELRAYVPLVLEEEGSIDFVAHRAVDDDHVFVLYETYRDRSALDTHIASEHYRAVAAARIRPLLAEREVTVLAPL
jgi:quinol monooxygenase YgiN